MDAPFFRVNGVLGMAYLEEKNYTQAIANLEQAVQLSGEAPGPLGHLGYGYAVSGRRRDAEEVLSKLRQLSGRQRVSPLNSAIVYVSLGETNRALDLLEQPGGRGRGTRLAENDTPVRFDTGTSEVSDLLKK